jgi:hypothetical protein
LSTLLSHCSCAREWASGAVSHAKGLNPIDHREMLITDAGQHPVAHSALGPGWAKIINFP